MISYEPFFETLKRNNISQYKLIKDFGVSRSLLDKLKHNKNVRASTLEDLCKILDCEIEDIIKIVK